MREAAHIACIDETIDSLTKGYDTIVGERGVTLVRRSEAAGGHCPYPDPQNAHSGL